MRPSIVSLLLVSALASKAPAAISIAGATTYAQVFDGVNTNTANAPNTAGGTAIATLPGYFSQTTTNFSTPGDAASFSGSFDQVRGGDRGGYAFGWVEVHFTTGTNVSYSAAGSFSNSASRENFFSYLFDATTTFYVYYAEQDNVGPGVFTLGGADGNYFNSFFGSLTGTLPAGHLYYWVTKVDTDAFGAPDSGAVAGGNVSLTMAPVPEFSSAIIWSLVALVIGGAGWWTR